MPSVAEQVRNSPNKPAMTYENMKMKAGATSIEQRLYSPSSKAQVKNLQRNAKMRKGDSDIYQILLRLSQEYRDMTLFVINPRILVVQIDKEMLRYARSLLKNISFKKGGGHQMISCDTQYKIGT